MGVGLLRKLGSCETCSSSLPSELDLVRVAAIGDCLFRLLHVHIHVNDNDVRFMVNSAHSYLALIRCLTSLHFQDSLTFREDARHHLVICTNCLVGGRSERTSGRATDKLSRMTSDLHREKVKMHAWRSPAILGHWYLVVCRFRDLACA